MGQINVTIPRRFIERYQKLTDSPEAFFESLLTPLPKSFRVNTLKATAEEIAEKFASYGIRCSPVPWYSDAFVSNDERVGATLERFLGKIHLQELSSMLPPLVVKKELVTALSVLDACAAPGSKTTQLAALMDNQGILIANDSDYQRIRALKFNANKAGVLNVVITNYDLREFPLLPCDVVLLDAPCSSEGTLRKNPILFTRWSEHRIRTYAGLQRQLILRAFDLLAPGGVLVYATCTFAPEENEAIVDWLLQEREAKLMPIEVPHLKLSPALREWEGQQFNEQVSLAVRLLPHENNTNGFFVAKIRK